MIDFDTVTHDVTALLRCFIHTTSNHIVSISCTLALGSISSLRAPCVQVFDECHHAMDGHPYNTVLMRWKEQQARGPARTQVA